MLGFTCIIAASMILGCHGVAPLSPEELKQIRDFTTKAHMKRLQSYPDQLMTPSTHYLGRRIPAGEKQPTIFMEAPSNTNSATVSKPAGVQLEQQPVQNYLINYPFTTSTITQGQSQNTPVFQQRPQQAAPLQFVPVQNAGPLRGPPPPLYKRPSFFSFGGPESSPPTSLLQFFFPKRPARRPPTFRTPIRFEYAQTAPNPAVVQHHQNLHKVMAQQHLLAVQQQQQQHQQVPAGQQSAAQPSAIPLTAQSTTIKTTVGSQSNPTSAAPSGTAQGSSNPPVVTNSGSPILIQNFQGQHNFIPNQSNGPLFNLNQFHREVQFFGKPVGKPVVPQKFAPYPKGPAFVTQGRPVDEINYIQKFASPQHEFSFLPHGPHMPPVVAGPTSNRFVSPVSFSHIEQMPFTINQPQQLPMPMVVQSQEFPHYHFTTTFTASNNNGKTKAVTPSVTPTVIINTQVGDASLKTQEAPVANTQAASVQSTRTHRVKKLRPRTTTTTVPTTTTYSPLPTTTQSLGDVIFESAKETREFHDSAHISPPTISNLDTVVVKPRKAKQQKLHQHHTEVVGSLPKASVESSVVVAPLTYTEQTQEPLISTSSPRPITSTLVSVSTVSTTTQEPIPTVKPKLVKSGHKKHHHHHQEKKVTASGAGLGAVTVEPLRLTSTGASTTSTSSSSSSKSALTPAGRVVTTSITSRVVSTGATNPHKRYRLRKVKVPNPDAIKANNRSTTTLSSLSSSSSTSSTANLPSSTTPLSTRIPRSTTTTSATESSLSTTTV